MAGFGQHFQVKRVGSVLDGGIYQPGDGGEVHHNRAFGVQSKLAIKVPKINTFRQRHAALTLHVLTNFVFGRFQQTLRVLAFDV